MRKNSYGRQLARVHAPQYHETLFAHLYPGKQDSSSAYIPVLQAMSEVLKFATHQKQRTIVRSDTGFGSDHNVNYALGADWQVLTKGKGGKRPAFFAAKIADEDWQLLSPKRWGAVAVDPPTYVQPTQHFVIRWVTAHGEIKHSTLLCSVLDWSLPEVMAHYDDRGSCETEIQADKRGLQLERRRKKHLAAQEALILMTDVAHNLLAWTTQWMFPSDPFAHFGPLRLTQDVLTLPGRLLFEKKRLVELHLNKRHPHAQETADGLQPLLDHFDLS